MRGGRPGPFPARIAGPCWHRRRCGRGGIGATRSSRSRKGISARRRRISFSQPDRYHHSTSPSSSCIAASSRRYSRTSLDSASPPSPPVGSEIAVLPRSLGSGVLLALGQQPAVLPHLPPSLDVAGVVGPQVGGRVRPGYGPRRPGFLAQVSARPWRRRATARSPTVART